MIMSIAFLSRLIELCVRSYISRRFSKLIIELIIDTTLYIYIYMCVKVHKTKLTTKSHVFQNTDNKRLDSLLVEENLCNRSKI